MNTTVMLKYQMTFCLHKKIVFGHLQLHNSLAINWMTHFSYEKSPKFKITFDRAIGSGYGGIPPSNPEVFVVCCVAPKSSSWNS